MGLSCYCDGDYDWFYEVESEERIAMTDFKCYGCGKHYPLGTTVRRVRTYEMTEDGEEIEDDFRRLCESCGDLYDSFTELGFCLSADQNFIEDARQEYAAEYGRTKK